LRLAVDSRLRGHDEKEGIGLQKMLNEESPSMLSIRPATVADLPAITAIYRPAVLTGTASFELEPPDEAEMARRMQAILASGFPYLVAEHAEHPNDGEILGYGYLGAYRPRAAYRWSVENSIYVAPFAQRTGAGRLVLQALIEAATTAGFRQMIAVIGDSQSAGSIGLHTALGFSHAGMVRSVGFKHGRWLDQVIMQRPIGPGDTTPASSTNRGVNGG
jgi:L-amino acid N-acyltransferase YncA